MTNKLIYFIGNWKMFGDFGSIKIIKKLNNFYSKFKRSHKKNKIVLCVPYTLIDFFTKKHISKFIFFGAQNCHYEQTQGPFTGSISASMIKKMGAQYVILGHSENRIAGDTIKIIKTKVRSALNEKLNVIFCIGETLSEKRKNKTFSAIRKQIRGSIDKKYNSNKIIFAYEPVWSIGTGKIPKKHEIVKIFNFLKKEIKKIFKKKKAPKIIYGGSVNAKNISLFSSIPEIDGFLIGGASQSSKKFIDIIKNYYK